MVVYKTYPIQISIIILSSCEESEFSGSEAYSDAEL